MADAWGGAWGTSWGVSWGSGVTPPPVVTNTNWDTSDPLFYNWWRKKLNKPAIKEVAEADEPALVVLAPSPATIKALTVARSPEAVQKVIRGLVPREAEIARDMLAEWQQMIDEDDEEILLMASLH